MHSSKLVTGYQGEQLWDRCCLKEFTVSGSPVAFIGTAHIIKKLIVYVDFNKPRILACTDGNNSLDNPRYVISLYTAMFRLLL